MKGRRERIERSADDPSPDTQIIPRLPGFDDASLNSGCYLLHFSEPYRHAAHYLGYSQHVPLRLAAHRNGNGARLIQVISRAGIAFVVAKIWPGASRDDERRLKRRGGHRRICPICRPELRK